MLDFHYVRFSMNKPFILLILCTFAFGLQAQIPDDPLLRAHVAWDQGDHATVVKLLTQHLAKDEVPEVHLVQVHYLLGEAYYALGKSPKQARKFRDAWERAYTHLATVQELDKGRFGEMAAETLEFLAPYLYNQGVKQYNSGHYAQADRYFWKTRQIYPEDPQIWLASAFTFWKRDQYEEALAAWQKARGAETPSPHISPDYVSSQQAAHVYWQLFVTQLGPPPSAKAYPFPQPFDWAPPTTILVQANILPGIDEVVFLQDHLQAFPEDVKARESLAAILWKRGQHAYSRAAYKEILAYDSHHTIAHQCWANFYLEKAFDAYMQYQERYDARRKKGRYIQPYTYLEAALPHLEALTEGEKEEWPSYVEAIQQCLDAVVEERAN